MSKYANPSYDKIRIWIKDSREHGHSWDDIKKANLGADKLVDFLTEQKKLNYWPDCSVDDWENIVELEQNAEENIKYCPNGGAFISDSGDETTIDGKEITVPRNPESSWQQYRHTLSNKGFETENIDKIEQSVEKILKKMSQDSRENDPVKGLVIGNVQSGKTAHMAGLMAMAADWGWNLFIILSGTIENLRVQTENRLYGDLYKDGQIAWERKRHLGKGIDPTSNLLFNPKSRQRYFTVCLKNPKRLTNLIQWLDEDKNKLGQMKILVIDDEADQASINTASIGKDDRKKINDLIVNLVNGKNEHGEDIGTKYLAMNYIGYTATPYANILNEASPESLYPRNFITTLDVPKEYFGPQQIFGYCGDGPSYDGLNIVRTIKEEDLNALKCIHDGDNVQIPESLEDAIAWFICCVCSMRSYGHHKPVSMLVHTSQITNHHEFIAHKIEEWLNPENRVRVYEKIKQIWTAETEKFSKESLMESYPDSYKEKGDLIKNYPDLDVILGEANALLSNVSKIKLNDEGDLEYHTGIHICIDNYVNNGINDEGEHVRLAYPVEDCNIDSPAFIVIGGSTLSRGLTIEGLVSSYFIRSVNQADTLMQMGRWFGYRKGYELLPRIWMTKKTRNQFSFLSELDQELRNEILRMEAFDISPAKYAAKIKNTPKLSFIRITAKKKMQSAIEADMNYSGASHQTYLFDNDADILKKNLVLTEKFILSLGNKWEFGCHKSTSHLRVWRNIPFTNIHEYLKEFKFNNRLSVFGDIDPLLEWIQMMTVSGTLGSWNVILAGNKESSNEDRKWTLSNGFSVNKVGRSRLKEKNEIPSSVLNIKTLRDPNDLLSDINLDDISEPILKKEISEYLNKPNIKKLAPVFRDKAGLLSTPQLIIYCIDKDSKAQKNNSAREDLHAAEDIIGLSLYIPGEKEGSNYVSKISINLENSVFDDQNDLEN